MIRVPLTRVEGRAYPLGLPNIDTDTIIAGEWLKTITRTGLGRAAFAALRADRGNVFDRPDYAGAPILIAGENFGCGSSREHAAWALADMGVRVVIAPGFSDIFAGNAFKNGLLALVLPREAVDLLLDAARQNPIAVDLESQTVTIPTGETLAFAMDPFRKECLLNGVDEIGLTLEHADAIAAYETRQPVTVPPMRRARVASS